MKNKQICFGLTVILATFSVHSETLLKYNFPEKESLCRPSETQKFLAADELEFGLGIQSGNSSAVSVSDRSLLFDNKGFNSKTEKDALNAGDYLSIHINPRAGASVALTNVIFSTLRRDLDNEGLNAPDRFAVYIYNSGAVKSVASGTVELQKGDARTFITHRVDLSAVQECQDVRALMEIRLVFWASQGIGSPAERKLRIDDIIVEGTTVSAMAANPDDWYAASWIHSHISLSLSPEELDFISRQIETAGLDAIQFHTHRLDLWDAVKKEGLDKKLGFKMVSIINAASTWYSQYDADPAYIYRVHADGSFAGRWTLKHLCVNAPVVRERVIPEKYYQLPLRLNPDQVWIDECVIGVNLCWCPYCTALYKEKYHSDPPIELTDNNYAEWEQWVTFHRDCYKEWMKDVYDSIQRAVPGTLVTFNHSYFMEQPETPPEFVKNLSADIHNDHLELGLYARYGGSQPLPFDLMPGLGDDIWAGIHPKSLEKIYNDVALITAHGGRWNIGEYPTAFTTLRKEPQYRGDGYRRADIYMDLAGKGAAFARDRQVFCQNTRPVPYVAVLHAARTHYAHVIKNTTSVNEKGGYGMTTDGSLSRSDTGKINSRVFWPNNKPVYDNVIGAYESLLENHVHFNFITEDLLQKSLEGVRLLILPEQFSLDTATVESIRRYVAEGGAVLATGSTLDAGLTDVFGVVPESPQTGLHADIADGTVVLDNLRSVRTTTATAVKACSEKDFPLITKNRYGKGVALYIAGDIYQEYFNRSGYSYRPEGNGDPLREFLNSLYHDLLPNNGKITLQADPWYELTVRSGNNGKTLVHIINREINWKAPKGKASFISVSLPVPQKPAQVTLEPGAEKLKFTFSGGRVDLTVDAEKIKYYRVICIQ